MENQIVNSQFKLLGTAFNISNITIDLGILALAIGLVLISIAIFSIVRYLRDKNNIPDTRTVEILQSDVKYNTRYIKSLEQRIEYLEDKDESVTELYKLVKELKVLIKNKK